MATPSNWTWAGDPADGRAIIVDVDGVIADAMHRQHYLDGARRDWRGFFGACDEDPPIDSLIRFVALLTDDMTVVLLTARPYYVHAKTVDWLERHAVRWDLLVMRGRGHERLSSAGFKKRSVAELVDHGLTIEVALDDDLNNIEMYQSEGIPAVYIHSGYYD